MIAVCVGTLQAFSDLAVRIFTQHPPVDPAARKYPCPNRECTNTVHDWCVLARRCILTELRIDMYPLGLNRAAPAVHMLHAQPI